MATLSRSAENVAASIFLDAVCELSLSTSSSLYDRNIGLMNRNLDVDNFMHYSISLIIPISCYAYRECSITHRADEAREFFSHKVYTINAKKNPGKLLNRSV